VLERIAVKLAVHKQRKVNLPGQCGGSEHVVRASSAATAYRLGHAQWYGARASLTHTEKVQRRLSSTILAPWRKVILAFGQR
jgi:hypothetical protein